MESATNDGRPSPENLLFIMSDEHTRSVLGCYGNRSVHTPNLDRLAAEGTRFTTAYTPSPVCVSSFTHRETDSVAELGMPLLVCIFDRPSASTA